MEKYTVPNLRNAAVLTIDTQNDFSLPGATAEIKGTYEVLSNMVKILEVCRKNRLPIIHVLRIYKADGSNADICRKEIIESGGRIVNPDTEGADLVDVIKPIGFQELRFDELLAGKIQQVGSHEWAIYKPRWGAFYQTKLDEFLRRLEVDTLVFIGCNFPNCPRTSIYEASERDYRLIMIEDAVSGTYERGLTELSNIGVRIYHTHKFISELKSEFEAGPNCV
ncbi:cysteine hydrolase family protein [Paenibacillus lentus]|uniref:cysteine hydrolase family protein n=1 Tax=Paenibacillus lentus TaxID=1338368 RepID=UPI00366266DD